MARLGRGLDYELAGSVATLKRKVNDYREAGATALNLRCFGEDLDTLIDMITTFAREIIARDPS